MLTTCSRCRRRDYCENCTKQEDCYWLKVIPPEEGRRLSCESFKCRHYEDCRKVKAEDRKLT